MNWGDLAFFIAAVIVAAFSILVALFIALVVIACVDSFRDVAKRRRFNRGFMAKKVAHDPNEGCERCPFANDTKDGPLCSITNGRHGTHPYAGPALDGEKAQVAMRGPADEHCPLRMYDSITVAFTQDVVSSARAKRRKK